MKSQEEFFSELNCTFKAHVSINSFKSMNTADLNQKQQHKSDRVQATNNVKVIEFILMNLLDLKPPKNDFH